ncbi:CBS domain-containing protein [Stappia taiwanensis]|uniref:CBS domain-containing protein n=1 Tax=Stappia taiwanensis TaxID=992267 RepID=A0A838XUA2_9HYPH|nr:CBS domain-containing protein [Stappia taiwanensis]MBA4610573.1 CBS domain-containing protein [Stappia taiwanensis]GGE83838.1 inosine-5-monophosphate dehydrogenase [Stappia taiwanensis]
MTVASILNEKGREVTTEQPATPLREICAILCTRRIGAIVITDDKDRIVGIISERDVVRAVSKDGVEALDKPVSAYMTKNVETCEGQETVNSVMARMTGGRFRHVPVVQDGRLAGLVSIGDVVKHRIAQIEREAEDMRNYIAMT